MAFIARNAAQRSATQLGEANMRRRRVYVIESVVAVLVCRLLVIQVEHEPLAHKV